MADIRIKDLTTTASSTASDDFIAVDGTTNGTRKLNAFSPTFGGNATVTGTLTVNNPVVAQGTAITGYQFLAKDTGGTAVGAAYALQTSGGTDKWRWGLRGSAGSLTDSLIFSSLSGSWADVLTLSNAGVVSISATTASTSTSTGALVVSGGVGVAGAIVAGGAITSTASTDSGLLQLNLVNSSTGTSASSLFRFNAGTRTATLQAYNDTHATLAGQLRVATSNGDIVVIPSGVTAATFTASGTTFAGAIAIGNTVNTVSPTSPNRTITMVIGGTTYYLAAKTTND